MARNYYRTDYRDDFVNRQLQEDPQTSAIRHDMREVREMQQRQQAQQEKQTGEAAYPKTSKGKKRIYVRYDEGAELYSMCKHSFMKLAADAHAVYKINRLSLVNTKIFEDYLETFRI